LEQVDQRLPLLVGHEQCLARVVGEIGVASHAAPQVGAPQKLGVEEQRPALGVNLLALVGLAAYLSRCHTHQRMPIEHILHLPIRQVLERLIGQEHAIHVIVVERVTAVLQLIVVDDRDERVQHRSTYIAGIVVDLMYLEYLLHICLAKLGLFGDISNTNGENQ